MKTLRVYTALVAAALLSGCATIGEQALTAGTTGSMRFAAEDVDAAIAIAEQAQDAVAEACFRALKNHAANQSAPVVKGVVSAYAAARARARDARAGLTADVHVACSPLIVDSETLFSRLGILLGP